MHTIKFRAYFQQPLQKVFAKNVRKKLWCNIFAKKGPDKQAKGEHSIVGLVTVKLLVHCFCKLD